MSAPRTHLWEWLSVGGLVAAVVASLFLLAPQPQDPVYHQFADRLTRFGIPHFWNVISNVPFLAVGVVGLWLLLRDGGLGAGELFLTRQEKLPFLVMFFGVGLTGLGSAYYHLDPTNRTLLWDRLPMAVSFMGLFAGVLGERTRPKVGAAMLGPLLLLGVGSVLYWYWTELQGRGNLRPYLAMQFAPALLIPLLLLATPSRYSRGTDYVAAVIFYVLAKALEQGDAWVYGVLGGVGGHPVKHVAAALSTMWILRMLILRRPLATSQAVR